MDEQVPNPKEDLEHAHALLTLMSPEELLKATYALEEIVEDSPRLNAKLDKAAEGPWSTMEEVMAELGVSQAYLDCIAEEDRAKAAPAKALKAT
jgi:hypothetical protein